MFCYFSHTAYLHSVIQVPRETLLMEYVHIATELQEFIMNDKVSRKKVQHEPLQWAMSSGSEWKKYDISRVTEAMETCKTIYYKHYEKSF